MDAIAEKGCFLTVRTLLGESRRALLRAGIENGAQEAVWLLEGALGRSALRVMMEQECPLSDGEVLAAREAVARRARREPLQYILGTQEFCGLEFEVNPAVLIPRPETELLVQAVIRHIQPGTTPKIVEVGTGSGCVVVALAKALPDASFVGIDISPAALTVSKRNAQRHGVQEQIDWREGDLLSSMKAWPLGMVEVVVSNPPYIREDEWDALQPEVGRYEPRTALVAGPTGTELHERLLRDAVHCLAAGGFLIMEVGQGQGAVVLQMARSIQGYGTVQTVRDAAGIERVVIAERTG